MTLSLETRDVTVDFATRQGRVRALDSVDVHVQAGQRLGILGGSGSGKTTLARVLVGLQPPTSGSVFMDGRELSAGDHQAWSALRRRVSMVFQDPNSSLNPRMPLGDIVTEPVRRSRRGEGAFIARDALASVQLDPAMVDRFPHELSGGQRQRVAIARALVNEPEVLIADEPVSALDVSVRLSVLTLLREQVDRRGLGLVFVSHDLAVVRHLCEDVMVMHRGVVVEGGRTSSVLADPQHPYTQQLVDASLTL